MIPKILGVVPARGGSKRIPRKNVQPVGGVPLVIRALRCALASRALSRVCVSSDDPAILDLVASCDAGAALLRPAEIAGDDVPGWRVLQHALNVLEAGAEGPFEAVAMLPPTAPLRTPEDIDATVDVFLRSGARSAATVVRVPHEYHPVKSKRLLGGRLHPFCEAEKGRTMAHQLEPTYVRNAAVYVSWRDVVENGATVSDDCAAYEMPRERSVDINEPLDLMFAELLLGGSVNS